MSEELERRLENLKAMNEKIGELNNVMTAYTIRKARETETSIDDKINRKVRIIEQTCNLKDGYCEEYAKHWREAVSKIEKSNIVNSELNNKKYMESLCDEFIARMLQYKSRKELNKITESVGFKNWKELYDSKVQKAKLAKKENNIDEYNKIVSEINDLKENDIYKEYCSYRNEIKDKQIIIESENKKQVELNNQRNDVDGRTVEYIQDSLIRVNTENAMVKQKKQNPLQKLFSLVLNKFNGKQRADALCNNIQNAYIELDGAAECTIEYISNTLNVPEQEVKERTSGNVIQSLRESISNVSQKVTDVCSRIAQNFEKEKSYEPEKDAERMKQGPINSTPEFAR